MISVSRLIRFQHKNYTDEWVNDGKPYGYFWSPSFSIASSWQGGFSRNDCERKWLRESPKWAESDVRAINLLKWFRWSWRFAWLSLSGDGIVFIIFLLFREAGFK